MIADILTAAVSAATPLLFATIGEIYTEKSGNLNLGVEGMMIMGSVVGFIFGYNTQSSSIALLSAVCAGMFGALIYAILTITLRANQVVSGLALTIFGTGFSTFFGKNFVGKATPDTLKTAFLSFEIPLLSKIPFIGNIFFNQNILVYLSYLLVIFTWIYMYKTRFGLNLRAVGESAAQLMHQE